MNCSEMEISMATFAALQEGCLIRVIYVYDRDTEKDIKRNEFEEKLKWRRKQ